MYKVKKTIRYVTLPYGTVGIIPAGTTAVLATNLPACTTDHPLYWAEPWLEMSDSEKSWARDYGYLLDASEVN